ncbi:transposase [Erythrobacter sp. HKB08]|uniref:transposase n=1 Tax=Erythrobacter sp. HKB08 TaxID=2502843 RepID=UPI00100922BF|nr:transposase [Erythrobacter sp. HKB08]
MPRELTPNTAPERIGLDECVELLSERRFDPRDEDSLKGAAKLLARLGANDSFLGDLLVDRLADRAESSLPTSAYSPQSIMLSEARRGFFLRANIWPSENDSCLRRSGAHNFAYGAPHDHNFDFLTVGYFGPGYRSDYYEYDYTKVVGYPGEQIDLRFVERSALSKGRLLHYRAHRDVHSQLPPESLSVSLNVMACDAAQGWHDQYAFDLERRAVTRILNPSSTEVFLRMAVALGGEEAGELAEHWGRYHPSDRIRLASFEARSDTADLARRETIWREAEAAGSLLVTQAARKELAKLEPA